MGCRSKRCVKRTRRLDGQWPRDVVQAACVTWTRDCCGCCSCAHKAWLRFEPGLESTTRQTLDWSRGSRRLPCIDLEREEHVRDEWLVLDLCGNGHCDPDGVVRRTVWDFHFRRL